MKKILALILGLMLCITGIPVFADDVVPAAAGEDVTVILQIDNPVMTVNGTEYEVDPGRGTAPVIVGDRTLLPVRTIIESFGGGVAWDDETQTVILGYGSDIITLVIESSTAYLNETPVTLDVAPVLLNERTMLPIRFIAESFGFGVEWNEGQQRVTVTNAVAVEPTPVPVETPQEAKTLVVYFSNTGNTKTIAEYISEELGADLFEIIPAVPYTSADLDYNDSSSRSTIEQNDSSSRPEIANTVENMEQYDTISLGYPIWWGRAPQIISTFLESYNFDGKTIVPFCTSASSGIGSSDTNLHGLTSPGTNWLAGRRFSGGASRDVVAEWLSE